MCPVLYSVQTGQSATPFVDYDFIGGRVERKQQAIQAGSAIQSTFGRDNLRDRGQAWSYADRA